MPIPAGARRVTEKIIAQIGELVSTADYDLTREILMHTTPRPQKPSASDTTNEEGVTLLLERAARRPHVVELLLETWERAGTGDLACWLSCRDELELEEISFGPGSVPAFSAMDCAAAAGIIRRRALNAADRA